MRETCSGVTGRLSVAEGKVDEIRNHLQVSQLGELLPTFVQFACEGLDLLVHDLVCAHVASLRKCLATKIAAVGSLAGVASFVSLLQLVDPRSSYICLLTLRLPS
jgi:hypothetical protein